MHDGMIQGMIALKAIVYATRSSVSAQIPSRSFLGGERPILPPSCSGQTGISRPWCQGSRRRTLECPDQRLEAHFEWREFAPPPFQFASESLGALEVPGSFRPLKGYSPSDTLSS